MTEQQPDEWTNCYDLGWQNLISPASFSHPAKFSRGLIFRIIEHALEDGLIQPGSRILDPFGGVALGALPALQNGLNWIGVELESKFVELGRQNIALWNGRFSGMPKWTGSAQIYQGDSRRLCEVVGAAGLVVSSPPYAGAHITNITTGRIGDNPESPWKQTNGDEYGSTDGQLGAMRNGDINAIVASPPFAGNTGGRGEASRNGIDSALFDRHSGGMKKGTGSDPANLDHLPQGRIEAVIGSPPYASGEKGHPSLGSVNKDDWGKDGRDIAGRRGLNGNYGKSSGQISEMPEGQVSAVISSPPFADSVGSDDPDKRKGLFRDEKRRNDTNLTGTYGETPGQLGAMKAGVAVVGSPPFENGSPHNGGAAAFIEDKRLFGDYGSTAGQIGATQGDTFWAAARLIVEQCALILPPNGIAIWIVKNYIKAGREVDFTGQWRQLCEACGFETVHEHRAMLVKEHAAQKFMLGGIWITNKVERKSFFRRLAERKGSPPIDFETILCTRKAA